MQILISLIAFLEGFTTLSIEIIALRKFTPIIGSNSISTSIILGVILLALSYGYYIGGKKSINTELIKKRIVRNLILASLYYVCITFIFDTTLLKFLLASTDSYFFSILIGSFLLFFIPIFLASQTIPLLAEIYKGSHIGETIGKLLFFSTTGSFFGSVVTSSFLFSTLGVHKSALLNSFILATLATICACLFIKKRKTIWTIAAINLTILLFLMIPPIKHPSLIFGSSNAYHNITIYENENKRIFGQNGAYASGLDITSGKSFFWYIGEALEQTILNSPHDILVIGAAGFTYPDQASELDSVQQIDVVDVDATLKEVSEKYFLEKKLSPKIHFYPLPARAYIGQINKNNPHYDIVFVDAYSGNAIPPQMLTKEFFESITDISDTIYLNVISDGALNTHLSKNLFATLESVWGEVYYKQADATNTKITNFIITNKSVSNYLKYTSNNDGVIYTDDKNSIEIDLFRQRGIIW